MGRLIQIRRPADQCPQPGQQFTGIKRFCQIVIGTCIQTVHTVTDLPQGCEHKNGDGYAVGSGTFEQRKAVQFRQHPVQDAGIVVSGFEKMQTIGTCMAAIGGESCCL